MPVEGEFLQQKFSDRAHGTADAGSDHFYKPMAKIERTCSEEDPDLATSSLLLDETSGTRLETGHACLARRFTKAGTKEMNFRPYALRSQDPLWDLVVKQYLYSAVS